MTDKGVIILSSSDEEDAPSPRKRIKPTHLESVTITPIKPLKKNESDIVILSDEEEDVTESIQETNSNVLQNGNNKTNIEKHTIKNDDFVMLIDDKEDSLIENNKDSESDIKNNCLHKKINNGSKNEEDSSIIVDDNSGESRESSGKENKIEDTITIAESTIESSTSCASKSSHEALLEMFIKTCEKSFENSQYDLKLKLLLLHKFFKKCAQKLEESSNFKNLIQQNMERAQKSSALAVISFNDVFQYVKEVMDIDSIEVTKENQIKLKKLEKAMNLLVAKINDLESTEVDFGDDEDSAYLQLDRYINRLNKVHTKYCEILKKNPHAGRLSYAKLEFVDSEYNEINRAISKKFKNNKNLPSYIEMENFIKKTIAQHNLSLTEVQTKNESVLCFKKLGELLQNRRKKELYDCHYYYIKDGDDPATKDISLNSLLKQNFTEGQNKIEKLCQDYVNKEELGEEAVLSEDDSDQSNYVDSENEDIDN